MMTTSGTFDNVRAWLAEARRPLLLSHRRPDGDALGSLAAMTRMCAAFGAAPLPALFDPLPPRYDTLFGEIEWRSWADEGDALAQRCDAVVILDTCSWSQLEPVRAFLPAAPRTLVIDHHATNDEIGLRPGDLRWIDATAGATCLLLAEFADAARIEIPPQTAAALFIGIATDCGWFRFSNTDARMLRAATALVVAGARPNELCEAIYQRDAIAKVRLVGRLLDSLVTRANGRLAVMVLRQRDFEAVGADSTMTEDMVNEANRLGGVEVTLMLTEERGGEIRVNLRSRRVVDVAALAAGFGGGGHVRAAGARVKGEWDVVAAKIIDETERAVRSAMDERRNA